jgi:hypothetical protein
VVLRACVTCVRGHSGLVGSTRGSFFCSPLHVHLLYTQHITIVTPSIIKTRTSSYHIKITTRLLRSRHGRSTQRPQEVVLRHQDLHRQHAQSAKPPTELPRYRNSISPPVRRDSVITKTYVKTSPVWLGTIRRWRQLFGFTLEEAKT